MNLPAAAPGRASSQHHLAWGREASIPVKLAGLRKEGRCWLVSRLPEGRETCSSARCFHSFTDGQPRSRAPNSALRALLRKLRRKHANFYLAGFNI